MRVHTHWWHTRLHAVHTRHAILAGILLGVAGHGGSAVRAVGHYIASTSRRSAHGVAIRPCTSALLWLRWVSGMLAEVAAPVTSSWRSTCGREGIRAVGVKGVLVALVPIVLILVKALGHQLASRR